MISNDIDGLMSKFERLLHQAPVDGVVLERPQGRPGRSFTDEEVTDIVNRYRGKGTLASIARHYATGPQIIRRILVRARVRIRRTGRPNGYYRIRKLHRSRMNSLAKVMTYLSSRQAPRIRVAGQPAATVLQTIYVEMARRASS